MNRNGWRKIALVATTVVAVGGAITILEAYAPWAPKITLAIAGENKLIRLDSALILLETLLDQAITMGNQAKVQSLKLRVVNKQREIKELEKLMEKHK